MEIANSVWQRQAAALDALVARHDAREEEVKTLLLAEKATIAAGRKFRQLKDNFKSYVPETSKLFLLSELCYKMNVDTPPTLIDLSRVPTREAALQSEPNNAGKPGNLMLLNFNSDFSAPPTPFVWKTGSWQMPVVSSVQRAEDLKMVAFKDLSCPTRHTGRMVVGRVVGQSMPNIDVTFHLEDPSGFALPVKLLFPTPVPRHSPQHLMTIHEKLYPAGTCLLIKEP
ncbi:hypothetical protein IAT38_000319 [Cryptococcus sp. DSM 104549]